MSVREDLVLAQLKNVKSDEQKDVFFSAMSYYESIEDDETHRLLEKREHIAEKHARAANETFQVVIDKLWELREDYKLTTYQLSELTSLIYDHRDIFYDGAQHGLPFSLADQL